MPLSSHRVQELRMKFNTLDKNGDKKLSFCEVQNLLRSKHMGESIEDLKQDFDDLDGNGDGFLNFHEFVKLTMLDASKTCTRPSICTTPGIDDSESCPPDDIGVLARDGEDFAHYMHRLEVEHPQSLGLSSPTEKAAQISGILQRTKASRSSSTANTGPSSSPSSRLASPRSSSRANTGPSSSASSRLASPRLPHYAQAKSGCSSRTSSRGPEHSQTHGSDSSSHARIKGPEPFFYDRSTCTGARFFYDRSTYTGARFFYDRSTYTGARFFFYDRSAYTGVHAHSEHGHFQPESGEPVRAKHDVPSLAGMDTVLGNLKPPGDQPRGPEGDQPRGPEGFFYDVGSYTGVSERSKM